MILGDSGIRTTAGSPLTVSALGTSDSDSTIEVTLDLSKFDLVLEISITEPSISQHELLLFLQLQASGRRSKIYTNGARGTSPNLEGSHIESQIDRSQTQRKILERGEMGRKV